MKEQLTEREVVKAAGAIHCLEALRLTRDNYKAPSTIQLKGSLAGMTAIPLTAEDTEAVLAFLIERHTTFLTGLNVVPDEKPL